MEFLNDLINIRLICKIMNMKILLENILIGLTSYKINFEKYVIYYIAK